MGEISLELVQLKLNFNEEGAVTSYMYRCGCGFDKDGLSVEAEDVISAHLTHLKKWHSITPRVRCDLTIPTGHGELRCVLERHDSDVKHSFEL